MVHSQNCFSVFLEIFTSYCIAIFAIYIFVFVRDSSRFGGRQRSFLIICEFTLLDSPSSLLFKLSKSHILMCVMKTATIDDVPDDVLEHILSFLSPYADLDACMYVCKRWYRTVKRSCEKLQLKFRQLRSLEWVCTTPSSSSNCSNISNRFAHAACYHKSGSIFVFGGMTSTFGFLNDIWKFDLTTRHWERLPSNGDLPQPRASSSLVAYCNTLILFGGWCPSPWRACSPGNAFYNNLHYYSMSTGMWISISSRYSQPEPLANHSASLVGDWMIVFGGLTASGYTNKIRVLDIRRGEWFHPLTSSTAPSPRCLHSQVVLDKEHLVIIGGECTDNTHLFDVWLLTIGPENATWQWGQLDVINSEPSRPLLWSRQACKVGDKAIILSSPNVQNYYSKGASQSEAARRSVQNNRTGSETNSSLFLRNDEQSLRSHISRAIAESSSQHLVTTGQLRSSASFSRKEQKRRIGIPRGYPLSVYALHLDRAISHRVALWSVVPSSSLGPQDTFFGSVIAGRGELILFGGVRVTDSVLPSWRVFFGRTHREVANNVFILKSRSVKSESLVS